MSQCASTGRGSTCRRGRGSGSSRCSGRFTKWRTRRRSGRWSPRRSSGGRDIGDELDTIPGHHAKALWVLLNCGPVFHTARLLHSVSSPTGRYWNLTTGFGGVPPDVSNTAIQNLRLAIAHLYRTEQGRGQCCTVEHYERDDCLYVFAYLDDYTQTHIGHDNRGNLTRHPLRPAFEVVFVYCVAAGTHDQYTHGDRRWRAALLDLFCEHILQTTAPCAMPSHGPYRLNRLIDRDFRLTLDATESVRVEG